MITTTCAGLVAALLNTAPIQPINLVGNCPAVTISKEYKNPLVIQGTRDTVINGLTISGASNITVRGISIKAQDGQLGTGPKGYGLRLYNKSNNVTIENVRFFESDRAIVLDNSDNVAFRFNLFDEIRQDGIIASNSRNIVVSYNSFENFKPLKTSCTYGSAVVRGVSSTICKATYKGVWKDGDHSDGIQLRNAMTNVEISFNKFNLPESQGASVMDAQAVDALNRNVTWAFNDLKVGAFHSITATRCIGCSIVYNNVTSLTPGRKAPYRFDSDARICGNTYKPMYTNAPGLATCKE